MLQKWKLILANWINCYYDGDAHKNNPVTQETLLKIISHLRENFNLNGSKSSILDAHTIQEFVLEKFPGFRFENGTVEPLSDEEIYLTASLLLYFVCVNSKDVDIKKAMCFKLAAEEQVIIFKFTKYLMDCRNISCRDVLTAIAEACEQDATIPPTVSETPPALRSLHSEVRRLQAALDAERFDRNYLQEELARTNLKMEKLVKDKEQYKQDIAGLKSKISCCGQMSESESQDAESSNNDLSKLLKQLEETEQRLGNVQEQLDEVTYERNTYKSKVDELKLERDKWFTLSQQEYLRTNQLTEELATERKQVTSLRELVSELRHHRRLNGLDCSQLECDDLDASVHSLHHNLSICSEVCANVVEVQLGEERAKIVVLQEQIQTLQDQLTEVNHKFEEESKNFAQIVAEKDNDIFNLKHRINEEIEEKNNLKSHCDNEMTKLNNEVNELEQRLRDTNEKSRSIIDSKMQEIQILQEEKLSLLKSLNDETTKLGKLHRELKAGLESERSSKHKMRDDMDNQIMKLKEKVLNRNNELVEFQNKIFEKGEMIERVQAELRSEKESHGDLVNKYNNDIMNFNTKIQTTENDLQQKIHEYRSLEEFCQKLQIEIRNRDVEITRMQGDIEHKEKVHNKENRDLQYNLDEINATVETLKIQLHNEIEYKLSIEDELTNIKANLTKVTEELDKLTSTNSELSKQLQKEISNNDKLKDECMDLNKLISEQNNHIVQKDLTIETTKKCVSEDKARFEDTCRKMQAALNSKYCKLMSETAEKNNLKQKLDTLSTEKEQLLKESTEKHNTIYLLQSEIETLSTLTQEHEITIKRLEEEILANKKLSDLDKKNFDLESTKLMTKLNEKDKCLKELRLKSNNSISANELQIETLKMNLAHIETRLQNQYDEAVKTESEKTVLIEQLGQMNAFKNKFEKEYMNKCALLSSVSTQLNEEIMRKNKEINIFKQEMESLLKLNEEKKKEINDLKNNIEKVIHERDNKIAELSKKIEILDTLLINSEQELKKVVEANAQVVQALQAENVQLQYTIEEDNSTHEVLVKEKDSLIEKLETQLKSVTDNIELLQRDYENDKLMLEKFKIDTQEQISKREKEITSLNDKITKYESQLQEKDTVLLNSEMQISMLEEEKHLLRTDINSLRKSYTESAQSNDALKENLNTEKAAKDCVENEKLTLKRDNDLLVKTIAENENAYKIVASEKDSLLNEKAILVQQLMEERSVRKIADEGKEALLIEAREMNNNLKLFEEVKHMLLQEKECLTQQLVEERHSKELAEQEKKNINEVKLALEAKIESNEFLKNKQIQTLSKDIDEQKQINEKLQDNIEQLKQEIEELMNDNEIQKKEILNHINIEDQLKTQNASLFNERNSLLNSLNEIKITLDETEIEKKSLENKILQTQTRYASEMEEKQQEIKSVSMEYKQLKSEHKTLEEESEKLSSLLNSGLAKIIDCLKKEDVCNEIMQKCEINNENLSETEICDVLFYIITNLTADVVLRKNLEKALEEQNTAVKEITEVVKQKEILVNKLQDEITALQKVADDSKHEFTKQQEKYETLLDIKTTDCHNLLLDNQSLRNELNDVKIQLEVKVHSLKDKLIDNENLTDKLKKTYECQIDNLNMMISKISTYLKEKTAELDALRNEKERLQHIVEENNTAMQSLEDELKTQKQNQEKLISDFESERLVFKNMVTVTESVMEDQKVSLNKVISEHVKVNENLENEVKTLKQSMENQRILCENKIMEKEVALQSIFKELSDLRKNKETLENKIFSQNEVYDNKVSNLEEFVVAKSHEIETLQKEIKELNITLNKYKDDIIMLEEKNNEWKIKNDSIETEFRDEVRKLKDDFDVQRKCTEDLLILLDNKSKENNDLYKVIEELTNEIEILKTNIVQVESSKCDLLQQLSEQKNALENQVKHNETLQNQYSQLLIVKNEKESEASNMQKLLQSEMNKNEENDKEKINLSNKCSILQEYQTKAEAELERRQKDIKALQSEVKTLETQLENVLSEKERNIANLNEERDAKKNLEREVSQDKDSLEHLKDLLDLKDAEITDLKKRLDERKEEGDIIRILKSENEKLITAIGQRETFAVVSQEESPQYSGQFGGRGLKQVDNTSDIQSSLESIKTISDLEKILQDKNITIKTLHSDITFLKSLFADSENKLLDVSKDLELSNENCHQLSSQLKKIVHQKNEEIADLKKQVTKMSFTENRATQIIKVSAKYQAIILKRIAEIKSNTVLKELTNFGNSNCDSDLRRSLTSGSITMEDLENFLETTERHLRRCSERQITLQKERDRLAEVNKINESEIINMQKFLTEMSVSIKTFNSFKEMYSQKLTRVVSIQRTVRREILNLESNITDVAMCKLERGYAAVMQDLSECAMNFERWMERCISRTISSEKIKQAFSSEMDRVSLVSGSFQNAGLEVQLEELENKFQKLLDEVARAQKGEGAKDVQSLTVMEVRAEYEDKLNRMKSKMKQLYQEQISIFKEKQRQESINLEQELQKAQNDLRESSRAYKEHIKELTSELWSVGEKFVMKHDEAEWLRKKQMGSLMSLQHVHSSGLVPAQETSRPSDTHSLRSLPVNNNEKAKDGRTLHMSDEEGEVFDNRWLRELSSTPRSHPHPDVHPHPHPPHPPHRLSELRWRNSLCPPHLKSSYPAETQFVSALHEEDIKCPGGPSMSLGGRQRKEVGITAYKKPGPPTPSKQAGRLSATDSELRECVREAAARRGGAGGAAGAAGGRAGGGGTPSRIRALFRSGRSDAAEGTPKTRRLSNIFRKK